MMDTSCRVYEKQKALSSRPKLHFFFVRRGMRTQNTKLKARLVLELPEVHYKSLCSRFFASRRSELKKALAEDAAQQVGED